MTVTLDFDEVYEYSTLKSGITIPIKLISGDEQVAFTAKVDIEPLHF